MSYILALKSTHQIHIQLGFVTDQKVRKENRNNENLTATAKESEYTAVVVRNNFQLTVCIITQKISYYIQQCCYHHKSKRPIFVDMVSEGDRRILTMSLR